MNRWNEFFILYNEGLANAYDKAMESIVDEARMRDPLFHEQIRNQVLNSMQSWYKKPFEALGNITPETMIDRIDTIEDVIAKMKMAAVFCDDDIPEYLKIKLGSFGTEAIGYLVQVAVSPSWQATEGKEEDTPSAELLGATIALKILGEWQVAEALDEIITKFIETQMPHELVADAFKIYITGVGEAAIPSLLNALSNACAKEESLSGAYEYVIIALTLVSQETKSDEVFACLRSCFRNMEHKVIGAICIGDYGDPKGITVLKGHLDRNAGKFDRQEFYEILSSIKRLGGSITDVRDPFRDFTTR